MALDLTALVVEEGTGFPKRTSSRSTGPNPFIEGMPNGQKGTLNDSWELEKNFIVTVEGRYEDSTIIRGPNKGQPTKRLVGEAAQVVNMLRSAAEFLGVGVAIDITPAKRKGFLRIDYIAKERRAYGKQKTAEAEVPAAE